MGMLVLGRVSLDNSACRGCCASALPDIIVIENGQR
jgi:hypothetical protein